MAAEDQPAPWLGQQHLPPPSTCAAQAHARQMPTLLEQLQMYEAQRARGMAAASQLPPFDARRGGGGQQQHAQQQLIARNTSFERSAPSFESVHAVPDIGCVLSLA